ncbi:MAG: hypothetical protein LBL58_12875 [Tannerellaceae bacterium]|jgi:hypothetical protein|nr:hypothetical protein [Tannerellaceae bacterium]
MNFIIEEIKQKGKSFKLDNMKKVILNILILYLSALSAYVSAQDDKAKLFKEYDERFKLCNYPFTFSDDYTKNSKVDFFAERIPDKMQQEFVYAQGIKKMNFGCVEHPDDGYYSYSKFRSKTNVNMYVICLGIEPGCGYVNYLLTYSDTYQLADSLIIEGIMPYRAGDDHIWKTVYFESILDADSINILKAEWIETGKSTENKIEFRVISYDIVYKVNRQGNFILQRQKKRESINYRNKFI